MTVSHSLSGMTGTCEASVTVEDELPLEKTAVLSGSTVYYTISGIAPDTRNSLEDTLLSGAYFSGVNFVSSGDVTISQFMQHGDSGFTVTFFPSNSGNTAFEFTFEAVAPQ